VATGARGGAASRYLDAFGPPTNPADEAARAELAAALDNVIAGALPHFTLERACGGEAAPRWLLVRAGHLAPAGALVTHLDITQRKLAELRAEEAANRDPLTGTLNRRGLTARLTAELSRARRHGGQLAAVLFDCDDFKRVNSRFGHAVGDAVLIEVARRFADQLRPEDVLARIGGDEFLALLPDANVAEARRVADRLRTAILTHPFRSAAAVVDLTCSAAVAALDDAVTGLDDILRVCAAGLQRSKAQGKNRTSGTVAEAARARARLLALAPIVVRQPIVELATGTRIGYELLVRGPAGLELPSELFRAALEAGVLTRVDLTCLDACLARAAAWPDRDAIHVNVFPSTLLALDVAAVAARAAVGARRSRVCLELCEQEIVGDPVYLRDRARALREAGFALAIDDVGFGRTSLEKLIVLEPELIKIDRRLVHHVASDAVKARQLARVVRLGHALDAIVVVDGLERMEDAQACRQLGVAFGQGSLWGEPEPA
jgi:diguanylate cyclase (GGDEF)-like protein